MSTVLHTARSVFAVFAGVVVMTVIAFAIEIPIRSYAIRFYPDATALDTSVAWMVSQWIYMFPALMVGGYVAAKLAASHPFRHSVAMASVQVLLTVALIFAPPHPVPPWIWALTLVVTPVAICLGGRIASKQGPTHAVPPNPQDGG